MGASLTDFNGKGFYSRDGALEVWLHLLAKEIGKSPSPGAALAHARDYWQDQATSGANGCIDPGLDDICADAEIRDAVIDLARNVLAWLEAQRPLISEDTLNAMPVGRPGDRFTSDLDPSVFTQIGEAFVKLLQGTLTDEEARRGFPRAQE